MYHLNSAHEKELLIQYKSLKQQLSQCHSVQKNNANQINSISFQMFSLVSYLFSSLVNRVEVLQEQYRQTRQHLSCYEDTQHLDSKYPFYEELDTNLILQQVYNFDSKCFDRRQNGTKAKGIIDNQSNSQIEHVSKVQNVSIKSTKRQLYEQQKLVQSIGLNVTQKLEDTQSGVSMRPVNRIGNYISKYPPLASSSNTIQTKQAKEYHKLRTKEQFTVVAEFVHRFLVPRLQYDQDHSRFMLPKKLMLNLYQNWCQENRREILLTRASVIQMSLTNELKIAFPSMDSYTKNYRGLKFINTQGSTTRDIKIQETVIDEGEKGYLDD